MNSEAESTSRKRIRVLLLEDRATDAEIMIWELRRAGFEPEWERVEDEAGFREKLDPALDLILADYNLPTFDGLRALDLVTAGRFDIPCIIVSGALGDELAAECIKRGAVDYLLKDRLARLGQAVSQALENRAQRRQNEAAVAALRRSEERFSKAFRSSPAALAISRRADGTILDVNDAFLELFQCTRDEAVGRSSLELELVGQDALERFRAELSGNDSLLNYEMPMRTRTGKPLSVLLSVEVVEDGAEACVLTTVMDVTERKRAEAQMEVEYAVTRALAEGGALRPTALKILQIISQMLEWDMGLLWKVDTPAGTLRCVEAWHGPSDSLARFAEASRKRVFTPGQGLPGKVWATKEPAWMPSLPDDTAFLRREVAAAAGLQSGLGFPIRLHDDVLGVVEFYSVRGMQPDPRVLTLLATLGTQIGQFIERQQLEDQYRQSQKMEAIGTLAGGIAHDFNNILTAIYGYTEIARMEVEGNQNALEPLDAVVEASKRATALVRQILAFSRHQPQQRSPMQLQRVVAEVLTLLRATIPTTIEIKAELDDKAAAVLADATQIHQVLMNLGTNAAQAMKDQPGLLEVRLENFEIDADFVQTRPALRPGWYVRLSVSDTGHGMDSATAARIFEPFFTTKAPGEGTGLGLSVVHGIMSSHDGTITVYSQPGEGTTFHLYFPAHGNVAPVSSQTAEAPVPYGRGQRILYVDDEQPLAEMGRKILERLGYEVDVRGRPAEALAAFRAAPADYDLVVTDLTMPGMTGIELARQLLHIRPELPVILMTGYAAMLTPERVRTLGIRELLLKPHSVRMLAEALQRAFTGETARPLATRR
jgi:PAS domain S-box-containing protein